MAPTTPGGNRTEARFSPVRERGRGPRAALQPFGNPRAVMGANRRHENSNLVVTAKGDGAIASMYLLLIDISTRPATIA